MEPESTITVYDPSGDVYGVVEIYKERTRYRVWSDYEPDNPKFFTVPAHAAAEAERLAGLLRDECKGWAES
jgi:hypothetical protein